eukprot:g3960.t1
MLNHHDWWEHNWGRTGASWPRRGHSSCWGNRGSVCPLPDRDNTVCLPGSRRGSTITRGWALDPKSQACKPGVHCLYACEPGYYWTTFNQQETSNFDHANAHQRGHCDGTWNYGTSTHGVLCKEDGTLQMPNKPLCTLGETYVYAENKLDTHVFLCQTVFPGHEIFLIPTLIKPGESVMVTTQPMDFWHGPTYSKPTHGDFYVSFAGADIMEACTWDEFSPSGASLLPYEIGSGVEDNGVVYSTHYFYQQPNSEVPTTHVGYQMDLECTSSEPGVCGPVFRANNVVKADVLRRPTNPGSTKVKFIFKKPDVVTKYGEMYNEPGRPHLQDLTWAPGMKAHVSYSVSSVHSHGSSSSTYSSASSTTSVSTFSNNAGGRRLLAVADTKVFLHNTLGETVVICNSDSSYSRTSVGPGEKITLQKGDSMKITTKSSSGPVCAQDSDIHWVITTGNQSSSEEQSSFSFSPYHASADAEDHIGYGLVLRCVSEDKYETECVTNDARSVSVAKSGATNDKYSSPEITFIVRYSSSSSTNKDKSYAWGSIMTQALTKFLQSYRT